MNLVFAHNDHKNLIENDYELDFFFMITYLLTYLKNCFIYNNLSTPRTGLSEETYCIFRVYINSIVYNL